MKHGKEYCSKQMSPSDNRYLKKQDLINCIRSLSQTAIKLFLQYKNYFIKLITLVGKHIQFLNVICFYNPE